MSIEKDLTRIAEAVEKIALYMANPTVTTTAGPVILTPSVPEPSITTVGELKALAQKIAASLPEGQIGAFTAFVRDEICARAGVKKLIEIPPAMIADAAKDLVNFTAH